MKTLLLLLLPITLLGQISDAALTTEANVIKNETAKGTNTALRVGTMFTDLINSKLNIANLSAPLAMSGGNLSLNLQAPLTLSGSNLAVSVFNSSNSGIVPSSGGGTTNFLRADGTWGLPSGTLPSGSAASQVLYYNGSAAAWNTAGSSGQILAQSGTTPTWTTPTTINSTAITSGGNIVIPVITTSSYTPTVTAVANINSISVPQFGYYQTDGTFYHLYAAFDVYTATSGAWGNVVFDFSFPAGVTWSSSNQIIGTVSGVYTGSANTPISGIVQSRSGVTTVRCTFTSFNSANSYRVYVNVFYHP